MIKNCSTLSNYTDCWHVYLSGGLSVGFNNKHGIKTKKDEKARLDRGTVFTLLFASFSGWTQGHL